MLMEFWQEVLWLFLQHRRLSNTYYRMRKEMFKHQLCLLQTHSTATRTKQIRSHHGLIFLWVPWLGKCPFTGRFNYSISLRHHYTCNSDFLSDFSKANNRGARSTGGFQTIPQQVLPCSWPRENQRYCRRVSFLEASHHENVQWQCDQTFCPRLGQIMTLGKVWQSNRLKLCQPLKYSIYRSEWSKSMIMNIISDDVIKLFMILTVSYIHCSIFQFHLFPKLDHVVGKFQSSKCNWQIPLFPFGLFCFQNTTHVVECLCM